MTKVPEATNKEPFPKESCPTHNTGKTRSERKLHFQSSHDAPVEGVIEDSAE